MTLKTLCCVTYLYLICLTNWPQASNEMSTDKMAVDQMISCQEVITLTTVLISKYGLGKKLFLIISLFIFLRLKLSSFSRMSNLLKLSFGLAYTFSKRIYKSTYYITVTTHSISECKTIYCSWASSRVKED
jgi:hypothetical protein